MEKGDYKHPIFNVSARRGGSDAYGGVFWEDLQSLADNHAKCPFIQIVGHTILTEIFATEDGKVIAVDVGMKNVFSGNFEYLKIKGKKIGIVKIEDGGAESGQKKCRACA